MAGTKSKGKDVEIPNRYSLDDLKAILEVVDIALEYSSNNSVDKFIQAFYDYSLDGRIHTHINLFGAKSFRITSNTPNMLNTPATGNPYAKDFKRCLVSSDKDHVICQIDYAALEDRIMANLSKDKNKCDIFLHNIDGHCLNSYYYFKEEIEEILPKQPNEKLYDYIARYKKECDTNKRLKAIRQKSKPITFASSYGALAPLIAEKLKIPLWEGQKIWNRYHFELYPQVSSLRDRVLEYCRKHKRIQLGLGCILKADNADRDIRTLFNAICQFWSILSLLTMHSINEKTRELHLEDKIEVINTIYDAIYLNVAKDPKIIKIVNDHLIKAMTKPWLEGQIIPNEAEMEIGYNWYDTVKVKNRASIKDITEALKKLDEACHS